MTTILVCNSNMFVPYVMSEVLRNKDKDFLILTDTANIYQFFSKINLENASLFKYGVKNRYDIFDCKKKLMAEYTKYDVDRLVFFHAEFGELINWFILKVCNEIEIDYCKIYNSQPFPKASFFKSIRLKLAQKLRWGMNVDALSKGNAIFPSLPQSFFEKVKAKNIKIELDYDLIAIKMKTLMSELKLSGNIVFLNGTVVDTKSVGKEDYIEGVDNLIKRIGAENIVAKCHPRFSSFYGIEKDLPQVPSYIPGNLTIDSFDIYIGYESTLLVEAAQAGKLVISTVYYLKPTKENIPHDTEKFLKDRLDNRGTILFPKTLDEIENIIKEYYDKKNN